MSRSEGKINISLRPEVFESITRLLLKHGTDEEKAIAKTIQEKMSRSSNKSDTPEAAVLSALQFDGVHSTSFAVSSKDREPIEQLLPCLKGRILILTSWSPNESGIEAARLKGLPKEVTIVKIHAVAQIQIIMKRPGFDTLFDHLIVDRIDTIDNLKAKKDKAAQILAVMQTVPTLIKKTNFFVTTMYGIPILYENVSQHLVV